MREKKSREIWYCEAMKSSGDPSPIKYWVVDDTLSAVLRMLSDWWCWCHETEDCRPIARPPRLLSPSDRSPSRFPLQSISLAPSKTIIEHVLISICPILLAHKQYRKFKFKMHIYLYSQSSSSTVWHHPLLDIGPLQLVSSTMILRSHPSTVLWRYPLTYTKLLDDITRFRNRFYFSFMYIGFHFFLSQ